MTNNWLIVTKSGHYIRECYGKGTKKQAIKWGNDHYIPGSFTVIKGRCLKHKRKR